MRSKGRFNYEQEIKRVKDLFGFDFITLGLVQSAEQKFVVKWEYALGNRSNRYRRIVLQRGRGVAGNVFKTGKPLLITDVESELSKSDVFNYPIVGAEGLTSLGAIPLYKNNRVNGVLLVAFRDDRKITPEYFAEFRQIIGSRFGPYYNEEMVEH